MTTQDRDETLIHVQVDLIEDYPKVEKSARQNGIPDNDLTFSTAYMEVLR